VPSQSIHLNHVVPVEESGIDGVFVVAFTVGADVGVQQQLARLGAIFST
jgi:hypothetical protein